MRKVFVVVRFFCRFRVVEQILSEKIVYICNILRHIYMLNLKLLITINRIHLKKFLGRRLENSEVLNGKLQFFCFRPTFGPIWKNFTCFRPTFGCTTKVGLKQENCIFPFRTSAFFCRRPKIFFECRNHIPERTPRYYRYAIPNP